VRCFPSSRVSASQTQTDAARKTASNLQTRMLCCFVRCFPSLRVSASQTQTDAARKTSCWVELTDALLVTLHDSVKLGLFEPLGVALGVDERVVELLSEAVALDEGVAEPLLVVASDGEVDWLEVGDSDDERDSDWVNVGEKLPDGETLPVPATLLVPDTLIVSL